MIISFSLLYSLAFPPSFLSSFSSFCFSSFPPSIFFFFFFLSLNYFYSFFSSLTFFSRSIFRVHYFYLLLSFFQLHSFPFPLVVIPFFFLPLSFLLVSILLLSMFLSSISVSFPSLYMLCATLHDRESIVGLFGFRFRRVARFLFTATYIAKDDAFYSRGEPLRSFCGHTSSKLNSPSPLAILTLYDSCDTDSLGFFKEWLIYQASFLDRDVENKSMDTQQSVSFPSFFLSSLFHFVSPLLIFSSSHSVQGTIIQWENLNILIISLVLSL